MESRPQNPEFRTNPENFHTCIDNSPSQIGQHSPLDVTSFVQLVGGHRTLSQIALPL